MGSFEVVLAILMELKGAKSFHPLKLGGTKSFTLSWGEGGGAQKGVPCLEGGGG